MSRSLEAYQAAYREHMLGLNYAEQTVAYKDRALTWFVEWCHERGIDSIEQITRPVLQRYQRYLSHAIDRGNKPLSVASQRNRLASVRTWFIFLMRENFLLYNPASEMELPRPVKQLPKVPLTAEEAEQILIQPDLSTEIGIRDRAIMEVLYSTGIRRQELVDLRLRDVNPSGGVLAIRQGKGKKDRFVPIGERALEWVTKYIHDVRPYQELPRSPENLFLDEMGQKMGKNPLSNRVKKYVTQANIDKEGSCHLFRHTVATLMLENGADIRFIQQLLGHEAISSTQIYTHVSIHKLKEVHQLTHPAKTPENGHIEEIEPISSEDDLLTALAMESEEEKLH